MWLHSRLVCWRSISHHGRLLPRNLVTGNFPTTKGLTLVKSHERTSGGSTTCFPDWPFKNKTKWKAHRVNNKHRLITYIAAEKNPFNFLAFWPISPVTRMLQAVAVVEHHLSLLQRVPSHPYRDGKVEREKREREGMQNWMDRDTCRNRDITVPPMFNEVAAVGSWQDILELLHVCVCVCG